MGSANPYQPPIVMSPVAKAVPAGGGGIWRNLLVPPPRFKAGAGLIGLQILAINLGILADPVSAPAD